MEDARREELSCSAKLARVVLENCGPLAPSEMAGEAYLTEQEAGDGLEELADIGLAEPVCGVCEEREQVYALTETDEATETSA